MFHLARQWIDLMKLFILLTNSHSLKDLNLLLFFSSGLTILTGKNLSFSFQTTSIEKIGFCSRCVPKNLPSNETIVLLSTDEKVIQKNP